MILYYSRGACSLAPHMLIREANVDCQLVAVDLKQKKTEHGDDFLAVNPKGYVPALRLDNGEVLSEVAAILQYIAAQAPNANLFPQHGTLAWFHGVEWLAFISSEVHKNISTLLFNPTVSDEHKAAIKTNLTRRFDYIAQQLDKSGGFLLGEQFTAPDAYLSTVLRWVQRAKDEHFSLESKWPSIAAYCKRVYDRPGVHHALTEEKLA